jgi:hypothetical protein
MFGLIEHRGIDENDGGTRHPTRRRLLGVCAPQSVIRAAVRDQICYNVTGYGQRDRVIMDKTAAAIRQQRHRDRRHRGFVCVTVEIGADDIGGLIDRACSTVCIRTTRTRSSEHCMRFSTNRSPAL